MNFWGYKYACKNFFSKSFTPCSKVKDPPFRSGSAFYLCTLGQKLSACSNFFEVNPSLSSQQHVVYCFKCNLCVTGYDRYICHHANQYIDEHNWCAMGKREQEKHDTNITILASKVLIQRSQKRYKGKLISLIYEMLYIFLKENQNWTPTPACSAGITLE